MLPKKNRLDTKSVEEIFKKSSSLSSPSLVFRFLKSSLKTPPRISFISPKSVTKGAVERNLLRRRGYTALTKHIDKSPFGLKGVFVFKKHQDDVMILENEIKNIFSKIN